ncbi:hypothetical protein ACJ73_04156, partial [Blastomyces percursus]
MDGNTAEPALRVLEIPPDRQYATLDEAEQSIDEFTSSRGYAVTRQRSDKNLDGEIYRVYLRCDRGGEYVEKTDDRKRNRTTRLIE